MSIPDYNDLLLWADGLADVMRARGRNDLASQIGEAKAGLEANHFTLAILGKAKRGKSTLINALLGRTDDTLAPIDKLPASSAITKFRHADQEQATIFFRDNRRESVPFARVREFVTEEFNSENQKGVATVEVAGPFPALAQRLELVDTPGAGSIHEHHDALLHAFIPQADAVIFLVTAQMPLDQDEVELLKKIKNADINKIFFVMNKTDLSEERDIEDAISHNQSIMAQHGISVTSFHRISAKQAFQGKGSSSGVPALMDDIAAFLVAGKGKVLRTRFISRVRSLVEGEANAVVASLSASGKSTEELDGEIARLRRQKTELEEGRKSLEREFEREWGNAVNDFTAKLPNAERRVKADVTEAINKTSSFSLNTLVKEMPTKLNQYVDDSLNPLAQVFEASTRRACEKLESAYPVVALNETGDVAISARGNATFAAGTLGGVAAAAGGVGFAFAGSGAAAAIAAFNASAISLVAANTAAASTVASAGTIGLLIDGAMGLIGLGGLNIGGSAVAAGAAGVATTTPALAATPLWVALSGPVGWTLAGVGLAAVPLSWKLAKSKQKDKLEQSVQEQVRDIFKSLRESRIPALRDMGRSILDGFRDRLDAQIKDMENTLVQARDNRPNPMELEQLNRQVDRLRSLFDESARLAER